MTAWSLKDHTVLIVLMVIFTFVVVVFLMNSFIGLLNMAIEKDNDRAFYLKQKAEVSKISEYEYKIWCYLFKLYLFSQILKDIELFYLLPHQRRRSDWFPDIM